MNIRHKAKDQRHPFIKDAITNLVDPARPIEGKWQPNAQLQVLV
jgi:hypothetical protein